jgi:predicted component of type VI protein secretion system
VGKLVLYFPDGSTREILLAKERITIGRRPDNDLSLPSPAVSAEHAAIVTVLDDSFLEDLGSTNGTFVNEKAVTKHFLRDRDRIDVGREILIYYVDDAAVPEELPPELLHHDTGNVLAPLDAHLAALEDLTRGRGRKAGVAGGTEPRPVVAEFDPLSVGAMTGQIATEFDPLTPADAEVETTQRVRVRADPPPLASPPAIATRELRPESASVSAPTPPPGLVVRVLDGPNAGREVALDKPETLIGRVGAEVVALRRNAEGVELIPVEGGNANAPQSSTPPQSRLLHTGDTFAIGGTTLQIAAV